MTQHSQKTCLLVLGMHRSGTSAVTRSLSLMGAGLPKDILGKNESNIAGHWESNRIIAYNDGILRELGTTWDGFKEIDYSRLSKRRTSEIHDEIYELIMSEFGQTDLFVLKDPRICQLAKLYIRALEENGITVIPILCLRNPLEVAHSLNKRDKHPLSQGLFIWLRHILDAEISTRGRDRVFYSFEELLTNWKNLHQYVEEVGGIKLPHRVSDIEKQINNFLRSDLKRNNYTAEDVALSSLTRDWIYKAYQALLILTQNPQSNSAITVLDEIRSAFNTAAPILDLAIEEFGQIRSTELSGLKTIKADLERILAEKESKLSKEEESSQKLHVELEKTRESLNQQFEEAKRLHSQLGESREQIVKRDIRLETLEAQLSDRDEAHKKELESIKGELEGQLEIGRKLQDELVSAKAKLNEDLEVSKSLKIKLSEATNEMANISDRAKALELKLSESDDAHKSEVAKIQNDLMTQFEVNRSLHVELGRAREALGEQFEESKRLHAELTRSQAQIRDKDTRIGGLESELLKQNETHLMSMDNVQKDLSQQTELNHNLKVELGEVKGSLSQFIEESANLRNEIEETQKTLTKQYEEVDRLQSELAKNKSHIFDQEKHIASLEGELSEKDEKHYRETENLGRRLSKQIKLTEKAQIELVRVKNSFDESSQEFTQLEKKLRKKINKSEQQLLDREEQIGSLKAEISEYERVYQENVETIRAQLAGQVTLNKRLKMEKEKLKSKISYFDAAKQDLLSFSEINNLFTPEIAHKNDIDIRPIEDNYFEVEFLGDDPFIEIDFCSSPLRTGYYQFLWRSPKIQKGFMRPSVYFDFGRGYEEDHKKQLVFDQRFPGKIVVPFFVPKDCFKLRLDLSEKAGCVEMGPILISPITKADFYKSKINLFTYNDFKNTSRPNKLKFLGKKLRKYGLKGTAQFLREGVPYSGRNQSYTDWVETYDKLSNDDVVKIKEKIEGFPNPPKISVVMPTYNTEPDLLRSCIESVRNQIYPHWELCIADDASPNPKTREVLENYGKLDSRIKVKFRKENGHISKATNTALELVESDWVALLDHDDLIPEHALFCIANEIVRNPKVQLIYSDEDKVNLDGERHDPYFKCDWNYHLFLSQNMISHLGVYRKDLIDRAGGFRDGFVGSQDYDLALRCIDLIDSKDIKHIPEILYHWRVMPGSTALDADEKPYAMIAGERALNDHFKRRNISAKAELIGFGYNTTYAVPDKKPKVSIVIPTRNGGAVLKSCLESLDTYTQYDNYEVIVVDNGSDDDLTLRLLSSYEAAGKIKLKRDPQPFNYSAINNKAIKQLDTDLILLLNDDIELIQKNWLTQMVSVVSQDDVGAVGIKLLYPDKTVQHAGLVLSPEHIAMNVHKYVPNTTPGYFGRALLSHDVSAATAACLLVKKSIFDECDGFNEKDLSVAYNDIDLCLKIIDAGYRIVVIPRVEAIHYESKTRGLDKSPEKLERLAKEKDYMIRTWGHKLNNDPAYNLNLSVHHDDFRLSEPPRRLRPWQEPENPSPAIQ